MNIFTCFASNYCCFYNLFDFSNISFGGHLHISTNYRELKSIFKGICCVFLVQAKCFTLLQLECELALMTNPIWLEMGSDKTVHELNAIITIRHFNLYVVIVLKNLQCLFDTNWFNTKHTNALHAIVNMCKCNAALLTRICTDWKLARSGDR